MNLICFPSHDVLHDLILPLYLQPGKVWVMSVQGMQQQTEHLQALLQAHGIAHASLGLPALHQCDDPQAVLGERLQALLAAATDTDLVLAVGASMDMWEHCCEHFLRQQLDEERLQVLALAEDGRSLLRLGSGAVQKTELPAVLQAKDYLAACHATLRSSDRKSVV
jgi:hypothetical protein